MRLLSYHGSSDGLRFGRAQFGLNVLRLWRWDRLSGAVSLYNEPAELVYQPDDDPQRLAALTAALEAREPRGMTA